MSEYTIPQTHATGVKDVGELRPVGIKWKYIFHLLKWNVNSIYISNESCIYS